MKRIFVKLSIFALLVTCVYAPTNFIDHMEQKDLRVVHTTTSGGGEELPVIHSEKQV